MSVRAALVALILSAAPAAATPVCDMAADLNRFIATVTDYPARAPCPVVTRGWLSPADTDVRRSQAGAFYPDTGVIEIAADIDLTDPMGQSYLVHELVHHAQYMAGVQRRVRCPAHMEREAYAVQAAFLRARGLPVQAVMVGFLGDVHGSCVPRTG
jgi:hypothetical protein